MSDSTAPPTTLSDGSLASVLDAISGGETILVAGAVDPSEYALGLHALCHFGRPDDSAFIVSTTHSADQTVASYTDICDGPDRPAIGIVDPISEHQYVSSIYGGAPTIFTPSPAALELLVIALSELVEGKVPRADSRHLIVRSLTPLLEASSTGRVCTILQRITGLRTGDGIGYFGLRYTEHTEETIAELARCVDGILWMTQTSDGEFEFEVQSTRRYQAHSQTE